MRSAKTAMHVLESQVEEGALSLEDQATMLNKLLRNLQTKMVENIPTKAKNMTLQERAEYWKEKATIEKEAEIRLLKRKVRLLEKKLEYAQKGRRTMTYGCLSTHRERQKKPGAKTK